MLKKISALLILLFPLSALGLKHISIAPENESFSKSALAFSAPFPREINYVLELEQSISESIIKLSSKTPETLRVSVQLENSMSINDEGPHLDLTDWKHCTSAWQPIKALQPLMYPLPDIEAIDMSCFPQVSIDEIQSVVLKMGGQRWADVIKNDSSISDSVSILIALSTVRLKIEKLVGSNWQPVTIINISLPLGC